MGHYKYYTPIELANEIMKILPKQKYDNIIDICCGSWNLLRAAHNNWPNAIYTGVDIDDKAEKFKIDKADYYNEDGRFFAHRMLGQTYDLVLSNPPFGYLDNEDRYLFNNFSIQEYTGLLNKRYENEMTLANIMLTKDKGVLLAILPSTFIEGNSNLKARIQIAKDFSIKSIIKLPINTFTSGEINSYVIVFKKEKNTRNTTRYYIAEYSEKWALNYQVDISSTMILKGLWTPENHIEKINSGDIEIYRGNISSSYFSKKGRRVLHCSSNITNGVWIPSIRHCSINKKILSYAKFAIKDDIIINRIGRSAGHWYVNPYDKILVSDCLLVLKCENALLQTALLKQCIDGRINVPLRGLTTSYITSQDIKNIFY